MLILQMFATYRKEKKCFTAEAQSHQPLWSRSLKNAYTNLKRVLTGEPV